MPYDQASFLAGVAAGRNMESWPAEIGSETFIYTVQVTEGDVLRETFFSAYMFFTGTIDWGDGTVTWFDWMPDLTQPPSPTEYRRRAVHAYTAPGIYQIKLRGFLLEWATGLGDYSNTNYDALISVDTPFPHSMIGYHHPYQLHSTFSFARNLVSLPNGLFKNVKYTRMEYQFYDCYSLTTLPSGLFDGCESVTEATYMFLRCGLTAIPPGLFAGMPNIVSALSFFHGCTEIHYVPPGLLDPLQKLENVSYMFSMPYDFPDQGLYYVPEHFFSNCRNITDFSGCFTQNTAMEEFPPALWDLYPDADGFACFRGCTNIDGYYDIPYAWGGPLKPGDLR